MQMWILLALLVAAISLYVTQVVSIEVTSLLLIVALAVFGILEPAEALSGFSSPATITVVAMLVLSAGVERVGIVDFVVGKLTRWATGGPIRVLTVIGIPTIAFSAFLNNTPVVAMMIPVTLALAKRTKIAPSKLLIPLSFFSMLGGTTTLIGTSTNLLVDGLYRESGGPGLGMFAFTGVGLIFVVVGLIYMFTIGVRLLPDRDGFSELMPATAPGHFVTELVLPRSSRYAGKPITEAFPAKGEFRVLEVVRDEEAQVNPKGEFVLRAGDVLLLESTARSIKNLLGDEGLEYGTDIADDERVRVSRVDLRIAEAVITPNSRYIGRKVRSLGLSKRYGVQVLAIRRLGRMHRYELREFRLRAGDVLLVQGETQPLRYLQDQGNLLLVEGVQRDITFPDRAPLAGGILGGVVVLAALGVAPIVFLAIGGIALMMLTRCLEARDALRAVDLSVVLLLAATIPLGLAIEKLGLAAEAATWIVQGLGQQNPAVLVGGLYVLTSLLTSILSNNATAVLLTPIALSLAAQTGASPEPLLMAIAFGASASFATPIGYQTNLMVMGPGGYMFRDYVRIGLPLNLLLAVVASFVIPMFWGLS
ncbi:MAG: SLC13 family permease [Planctomycetes bacterium]|nr:SLC13 family permease [Planctomycetota bacterium]